MQWDLRSPYAGYDETPPIHLVLDSVSLLALRRIVGEGAAHYRRKASPVLELEAGTLFMSLGDCYSEHVRKVLA